MAWPALMVSWVWKSCSDSTMLGWGWLLALSWSFPHPTDPVCSHCLMFCSRSDASGCWPKLRGAEFSLSPFGYWMSNWCPGSQAHSQVVSLQPVPFQLPPLFHLLPAEVQGATSLSPPNYDFPVSPWAWGRPPVGVSQKFTPGSPFPKNIGLRENGGRWGLKEGAWIVTAYVRYCHQHLLSCPHIGPESLYISFFWKNSFIFFIAQRLCLAVVSGGWATFELQYLVFSSQWLLLSWNMGFSARALVLVLQGPGCPLACGIFLDWWSNQCSLHW